MLEFSIDQYSQYVQDWLIESQWTSLHNLNIETILNELTNQLDIYYHLLALGKFQQIIEKYNDLLFRKNETCYFNINNQLVLGQIESVNELGLLKVLIGNELQEFAHKELEMII